MTALKTILFMPLVPGLLLGAMPIWLMQTDPALFSFGGMLGALLSLSGIRAVTDQFSNLKEPE